MKKALAITLGILTAIGGFVDIGDLVANALIGSRYAFALAWVVPIGVLGICLYAEMCGRVAVISGRPVFDVIRERLGPRLALANLAASLLVTGLTLAAEIGGVALAMELVTSVNYLLWVPLVGVLVWIVIWRVRFQHMETAFGLLGLFLIVFAVAWWKLGPHWGGVLHQVTHPALPPNEGLPTYLYYAIALFGAAMTPYEVFFFSSGAVEEHWRRNDLKVMRANVFVGFPLGGLLSLAIMGTAALVLFPLGVQVDSLGQVALPVAVAMGKLGLAVVLVGIFAATFGAALETGLSVGYTAAQFFGWQWGKLVRPLNAARFHVFTLIALLGGVLLIMTTLDPIKVTEYSIVFSAVALPLTYLPILIVANDKDYVGDRVNGRLTNALGMIYLVIVVAASAAAIPLMIATKAGQ
jgi:Mn2+/Fe2+ NRAMP family transporter